MATTPVATRLTVLEPGQAGWFAEIRDLFAPSLRAMVPAEALRVAWAAELDRQGPVSSTATPVSEPAGPGMAMVRIPVTCGRGELTVLVNVHQEGWLAGIQLAPVSAAAPAAPWEPPPCAHPQAFDEHDVTVGSGSQGVPGTLSLPQRAGRCPAIVLLGGSGPQDRDETIGRNKPLKDIAWGLASRGVAVLRFDKVTHARPREVAQAHDFTVADEYAPQAVAAVLLLRQHPAVDPGDSSCSATTWAARSPRASQRSSRPSPDWSSSPAEPSPCNEPPSGRSATSPRSTPRRPRPPRLPSTR